MSRFTAAGVPNYYGEQRFGRDGDNVPRARRWLVDGGRAPRGRFERKLLVSALQSALFNDVLAARLADGLFEVPVPGDLMRREETGGLFVTADLDEARARMAAWEISPTGPMFGTKMRSAEDEARRREESVLAAAGLDASHLARFGRAGEGARRPLRVRPLDATVTADGPDLRLAFELPAGAYATAITREILKERA
jgi:tRNA pseudouridine13 synthase